MEDKNTEEAKTRELQGSALANWTVTKTFSPLQEMATRFMVVMLANDSVNAETMARNAIEYAKALLTALEKEQNNE